MGRIIVPRPEDAEVDPTGYMGDMVRKPEVPKPLYFPEFQRCNPFREPEWRWVRACWLVKPGKEFSSETDDAETGRALRFVRALANCTNGEAQAELARRMPGWYRANEIYKTGGPTRWLIESRILAGQTLLEVARAMGLSSAAVYWYEKVFFNVVERLEATDYIQKKIIGKTAFDSITAEDTEVLLKLLAYYGGPVVLEASLPYVLNGLRSDLGNLSEEEAGILEGLRRLVAVLSISDREDPIPKLLELLRELPGAERVTEKWKAVEKESSQVLTGPAPSAKSEVGAQDHTVTEENPLEPAHVAQLAQYLRQTL